MIETKFINGKEIRLWLPWEELEEHGQRDVEKLMSLPFITKPVSIMPDGHVGTGVCIGSVIPTDGYLLMNAVGSDAGCGMTFCRTSIKTSDIPQEILRKQIMRGIRKAIPIGDNYHKRAQPEEYMPSGEYWEKVLSKAPVCLRRYQSSLKMIGTLGGGKMFATRGFNRSS